MTEITEKTAKLARRRRALRPALGRHGLAVGRQPLGQPDPCAALSLGAAADRRGDRRHARARALQRVELDPRADRLEPDPARAGEGRPARAFRGRDRLWEIAMRIAAVRKEREIDPAVDALKACVADAERDPNARIRSPSKRLKDMLGFVESMDRWYAQMLTVPKPKLASADPARHPHRRAAAARKTADRDVPIGRVMRIEASVIWRSPSSPVAARRRHECVGDPRFRALMCAEPTGRRCRFAIRRRFSKRLANGATARLCRRGARDLR